MCAGWLVRAGVPSHSRAREVERGGVEQAERGVGDERPVAPPIRSKAPSLSCCSNAGGVASSLPGQNGHALLGSASTCIRRGAKSVGRFARSATKVTHRPVRGFRRN